MGVFTGRVDLEHSGPTLEVDVLVSTALEAALRSRHERVPSPIKATALIDTGSTRTVIRDADREDALDQLAAESQALGLPE